MIIPFGKLAFLTTLLTVSLSLPVTLLQAEETDFSCMSHKVKGKIQVNDNYQEFDIILENRCPGPVYWSMCIERMDPWTHEVGVALTPSGVLKVEKKSKVNLQMKKRPDHSRTRHAYQEFYLNVGYAVKPPANARCVASGCESKKRNLRMKFRTNDAAWQKKKIALAARIATECPQSGWDNSTQRMCEAKIRESSQASMDQYAQTEKELKNKLSALDPEQCQVHTRG